MTHKSIDALLASTMFLLFTLVTPHYEDIANKIGFVDSVYAQNVATVVSTSSLITIPTANSVAGQITDPAVPVYEPVTSCSSWSVTSGRPQGGTNWEKLRDFSKYPEIDQYRIQWWNGSWSPWYTPTVDDKDTKVNNDGSWRYMISYLQDHNWETRDCTKPTPVTVKAPVILNPVSGMYIKTSPMVVSGTCDYKLGFDDLVIGFSNFGDIVAGGTKCLPNGTFSEAFDYSEVSKPVTYPISLTAYPNGFAQNISNNVILTAPTGCGPTSAPSVKVLTPNGAEVYNPGDSVNITWNKCNTKGQVAYINLGVNAISAGSNRAYQFSGEIVVPNTGSATYKLPDSSFFAGDPDLFVGKNFKFMVSVDPETSYGAADTSTAFAIEKKWARPTITIITPNGGETFVKGQTYRIKWDSKDAYDLYAYLLKDGVFYDGNSLNSNPVTSGYIDWTVPTSLPDGSSYKIKVAQGNGDPDQAVDDSDAPFKITSGVVTNSCANWSVTSGRPQGGTNWEKLRDFSKYPEIDQYRIQWWNGSWSPWYTPTVDDKDTKVNNDGSWRYMISYLQDHNWETRDCLDGQTKPTITVLTPNGNESYKSGDVVKIQWKTVGLLYNAKTQVDLMDDRITDWITKSFFGTDSVLKYAKLVSSNGNEYTYEYTFTVPENFDKGNGTLDEKYWGIFGGKHYSVLVHALDDRSNILRDASDTVFTINSSATKTTENNTKSYAVTSANQTAGAVSGQEINFTRRLSVGKKGDDVILLQEILIDQGFLNINNPTGYYGPITNRSVKKLQQANKIQATGVVGPLTRAFLNSIVEKMNEVGND